MISKIGQEMLQFQEDRAKEYNYRPIGFNLFLGDVRQKYIDQMPSWCKISGDPNRGLVSHEGMPIATGYDRIVVGDYGAFIEIDPSHMLMDNICVQHGQEYRINDERFRDHVKYFWYTATDRSNIKLYFQQKTVTYADYVPGMWYVSVYEVLPSEDGML